MVSVRRRRTSLILILCFIALCLTALSKFQWKYSQEDLFSARDRSGTPTARSYLKSNGGNTLQKVIDGFLSYPKDEPLRLGCSDCAFVTSSGHLLHSGVGTDIDSRSCVIRSNVSPTLSFEEDVGTRTTIRVVSAFSIKYLEKLSKQPILFDRDINTTATVLISGSTVGKEKMISEIKKNWPGLRLFYMTKAYDNHVIKEYAQQVVSKVGRVGQSNGFVVMLLAHEICESIHVYGMSDPDYCLRKRMKKEPDDIWYQYYQKNFRECANFERNNSGHDFFAEKELFRKWREKRKKIFFHVPEW